MSDPLDEIALGTALVVNDPDSPGDLVKLTGSGIPIRTNAGVAMVDGSSGSPISFPKLDVWSINHAFKFIMEASASLILQAIKATPDPRRLYMVSRDDEITFEELETAFCFDPENICECAPDWIVGWKVTGDKLCLVKYKPNSTQSVWEDTETIHVGGAGKTIDPYFMRAIISLDAGNRVEWRQDGLWVGAVGTTAPPTTLPPTTLAPTTLPPTTLAATSTPPTTLPPTTPPPTTLPPTTTPPTTIPPTTTPPTTTPTPTTLPPTTTEIPPTTTVPTTAPP